MEPTTATLARETRSSIELTRNAKGDYQWSIKAYFDEGHEDDALGMLEAIDGTLRAVYVSQPRAA